MTAMTTRPTMTTLQRGIVTAAACATLLVAPWAGPRPARAVPASTFEEGVASWYGGKFHGRQTASGEVFDKEDLTAAHRTLPFNTMLLVTNLDNGRRLRVRVNDRGPFVHDRVLDCSEGAARALDFQRAGTARVRLEILGELPEADDAHLTKKERRRLREQLARAQRRGREVELGGIVLAPVDPAHGPFAVQVGAFAVRANADRFAALLTAAGTPAQVIDRGDGLFRVQVGALGTREQADAVVTRLRAAGHDAFVVRDDSR